MKTKFNGILTLLLAFMVQFTFAQERMISGVVSDEVGPVSDISVLVKGTTNGTVTDFDGNYTIKAKTGDVLVFSHISYDNQEKIVGESNTINMTLTSSGESIDEVVVKSFGIKRKKSNDLSSATNIKVESIQKSGESGLLQSMAGKTSGVNIVKSGGDPGAGSFIQIRGANSILSSDKPLIVLDGVLISNSNSSGTTDGVAAQSRLNDIPASDIKSVTVLKGAAAAALYGSAASAGVIVMNTKSGASNKKWAVNVRSEFQLEKINEEWDLNTKFGQGFSGGFIENFLTSYGDKISNRSGAPDDVNTGGEYFLSESGNYYYPIINKNSTENFQSSNRNAILGNGFTNNHSADLSYNGENSKTFLSFSQWDQDGVIKNNSNYKRTTFRLNNTTNFSDKLKGKIGLSYINSNNNLIQQGSNLNGLYLGYLRTPSDFDIRDYKGTRFDGSEFIQNAHRAYRNSLGTSTIYNNPLWTVNEQKNNSKNNRFIISPELSYQFNDHLSLIARYNIDAYTIKDYEFFPVHSADVGSDGSYSKTDQNVANQYFLLMLQGNNKLTDKINFDWMLGGSYEKNLYESLYLQARNFTDPFATLSDLENIGAYTTQDNQLFGNANSRNSKSAGFGSVNFDLYDQFLVELTGRVEKSSTLIDKTFFFPSASVGWKFSKLLGDSDFLNFGKIRLSYGEVATSPPAYIQSTGFVPNQIGSSWGDVLGGSVYGGLFNTSSTLGNPNIDIERVNEYEVGTDLRLLKNKVSLGVTYYDRTTNNALVSQTLPASTGYQSTITNNGVISNKGIEIDLGSKIINHDNLKWNVNLNFSKNKNLVEKLPGGDVFLAGFTGSSAVAREGYAMSAIIGGTFLRDANGDYELDANGFPQLDTSGDKVIGDPNPDWKAGLSSTLSYKNLSLSASIETSQGNDVWNGTKGVLQFFGREASTANEVTVSAADAATIVDYVGVPINGLPFATANTDGSYTVRGNLRDFGNGPVLLDQFWYTDIGGGFGPVAEQFIEDASWVKLREITLSYKFNKDLIKSVGLDNVELAVSGRNLFTWTNVQGFDPERNLTGASKGRGLEYFTNPSSSSYNFSIKFGF